MYWYTYHTSVYSHSMAPNLLQLQRYGTDGWFFASVPSIPGLISFGPTLEKTLAGLVAGHRLLGSHLIFVLVP